MSFNNPAFKDIGSIKLQDSLSPSKPDFLKESVPFLKIVGTGVAVNTIDFGIRELTGSRVPEGYYRDNFILSIPSLLLGKLISDAIGGPTLVRALSLSTATNLILQLRYMIEGMSVNDNLASFIIRMVPLFPTSFAIIDEPPKATGKAEDPIIVRES
jgi:hypothetical protein